MGDGLNSKQFLGIFLMKYEETKSMQGFSLNFAQWVENKIHKLNELN